MTAPLTTAEVEQFAKLSAELDGGDITFYPTADDVAIVKRVLRALTAAPIEPTPIMLMRGYQACDDFIDEHGGGDVAALDDGQFNDMLADAYRAMVSTHQPSREELAVALSAAPTVAPGDGQ